MTLLLSAGALETLGAVRILRQLATSPRRSAKLHFALECTSDPGGSTPDDGTRQVVAQIERDICPSIDIEEMLRKAGAWTGEPNLDYVRISPWGRRFGDEVTPHLTHIELRLPHTRRARNARICYTLDGSEPTSESPVKLPLQFNDLFDSYESRI